MKHQTWIAACTVLGLAAVGSPLLLGHLDARKLRTGAAETPGMILPVELVLLVDTSGSVDTLEYQMQKYGYAQAFRDPRLSSLIESQGGIAVTYIEWSDYDHQSVRVDWTLLENADDCYDFADEIVAITREASGATMMAPAVEFAVNRIDSNDYYGMKRVIDISGDGRCMNYEHFNGAGGDSSDSYGTPWDDVRASLAGNVTQINGICISTDSDVIDFYEDILPYGEHAFAMQVDDFIAFEDAILEKLLREIVALPGLFD